MKILTKDDDILRDGKEFKAIDKQYALGNKLDGPDDEATRSQI